MNGSKRLRLRYEHRSDRNIDVPVDKFGNSKKLDHVSQALCFRNISLLNSADAFNLNLIHRNVFAECKLRQNDHLVGSINPVNVVCRIGFSKAELLC